MAREKGLVVGDVLDARNRGIGDKILRLVDQQEGIAVRQHLHDIFDGIHGGLPDSVLHEGANQGDRAPVTRFVSGNVRADARTSENKITNTIERLVPGKFIGPTERRLHHTFGVEHHRVGRGRPLNQPFRAQRVHFVHEPERPG